MISTKRMAAKTREVAAKLKKDDKPFFTSYSVVDWLSGRIYHILVNIYSIAEKKSARAFKVKVIYQKGGPIAYTDGVVCTVNPGCEFVQKSSENLWQKLNITLGLCIHELGHRLYTNFKFDAAISKGIMNGELIPEPSIEYSRLKDMISSKKYAKAIATAYRKISNSMEDGYIEYRMLEEFSDSNSLPLRMMRDAFLEYIDDYDACLAKEQHNYLTIMSMVLVYAEYGILACKESQYEDYCMQKVFECIPYIDECNNSTDTWSHYRAITNVMAVLQDDLCDYLESTSSDEEAEKEISETAPSERPSEDAESAEEAPSPLVSSDDSWEDGKDEDGKGKPSKAPSPSPEEEESSDTDSSDTSADDEEDSSGDEEDTDLSSSEEGDASDEPEDEDASSTKEGDMSDEADELSGSKGDASNEASADSEVEPYEDAEDITEEDLRRIEEETSRLLASVSSEIAALEIESEIDRDLKDLGDSIDYGDLHQGVKLTVVRKPNVSDEMKKSYHKAYAEPLRISNLMVKNYLRMMKDKAKHDFQRGRYFGQRFVPQAAIRADKKFFGNMKLPSLPSVSVGLLLDCSGSMSGDRINYARTAAVIIENFVRNIGGKCCIIGHEERFYTKNVVLHSYADFDSEDGNDRYRLLDIEAGQNNRDGYALRFMLEKMKRQPSDLRILILISDGAPAASGYGTCERTTRELQGLKKECDKNHIAFVAAAIGDDKPVIKKFYGDSFLDITNIERMPKDFVKLLQKKLQTVL